MTGHFISNETSAYYQSEIFTAVLKYVQTHTNSCRMKEGSGKLSITFQRVSNVSDALKILREMKIEEPV
jgi:transcription-repair coupling factor (superfamily II helicase)